MDKLKEKKAHKNLEPTLYSIWRTIASQVDCEGNFNLHLTMKYIITDTKIYTINYIKADYLQEGFCFMPKREIEKTKHDCSSNFSPL